MPADAVSDVLVIGGGIAGLSSAAELSRSLRVVLVEQEAELCFHSTGRSAALFSEIYGNETVRLLSSASRDLFFNPPGDFTQIALTKPRGTLFVARPDQIGTLEQLLHGLQVRQAVARLGTREAIELCPLLRPDYVAAALHEPDSRDADVHELSQAYLRELRRNSGVVHRDAPVTSIRRIGDQWQVEAGDRTFDCAVVLNAAGAWADRVARLAGVRPVGLRPCLRTALLVDPPQGMVADRWPLVLDVDEQFYFKPDAGALLLSPADETLVEPGDVYADELAVATAVDRVEQATNLKVTHVRHRWAGLRTFTEDRTPVAGFDDEVPDFFWLAGQGGYGIQTAPALAQFAAASITGSALPPSLIGLAERLTPRRLRSSPDLHSPAITVSRRSLIDKADIGSDGR